MYYFLDEKYVIARNTVYIISVVVTDVLSTKFLYLKYNKNEMVGIRTSEIYCI